MTTPKKPRADAGAGTSFKPGTPETTERAARLGTVVAGIALIGSFLV